MSSDESLRRLYERALAGRPARDENHPDDALWERVLCEEATADERRRVQTHVLGCPACADIYRSLMAVRREAIAFDPAVPAASTRVRWIPYALAASILLAAVLMPFLWRAWRSAPAGSPVTESPTGERPGVAPPGAPSLAQHAAFRLDKAPVMFSAALALTPRGPADDRQRFLDALGEALAPYRADDFQEAASRLTQLSGTYPDRVEAALYAGVALLLSKKPADAVVHLERARDQAPPELLDEIEWRLGLAYVHAGVFEKAQEVLKRACAGSGSYRNQACEALKVLAARQ